MIVKPANSAEWHYAEFEGKRKIHTVNSAAELRKLIADVKATSYSKYLLVQECLAVRDDSLHSVTVFCEHGEMVLGRVGHVLVQDRSAKGIGNPLVILGEDRPDLLDCAARFCRKVGYEGYGNLDVMDGADGNPRFLEINARPGRNTYYMTLAGVRSFFACPPSISFARRSLTLSCARRSTSLSRPGLQRALCSTARTPLRSASTPELTE